MKKNPAQGGDKRTQVRFPDDVYFSVRHVAAAQEESFNSAVISLLREALEGHRDQIPIAESSHRGYPQETD